MQGILVDHQIKSLGIIDPLQEGLVQPASVDLTLGTSVAVIDVNSPLIKVGEDNPTYRYSSGWESWTLWPGNFALFETAETLTLPIDIAGKFEGKSSIGRIGLMTHITAGFIDPGFSGVLTLEVYNCGPLVLVLRPGIRIGQVSFTVLGALPERAYGDPALGSHYQGAKTVEGGKFDDTSSNQ